jgi:hypothetical protein
MKQTKKLPFDKELAKSLTNNKNTLATWQNRGYIPISALTGKMPTISNDFTERVKVLYNTTSLKKSVFNEQLEYYGKFYDFCRKNIPLTEPELKIVTTTLKSYEAILDEALTLLRISETSKGLKLLFTICKPYHFLKFFQNIPRILDRVRRDRPFNENEQARFLQEVKLLKSKIINIYD